MCRSAVILSLLISVVACAQNDTTFLHRIMTDIGSILEDVKMTSFKIDSVEESVKDMATNSRLDVLSGNMDDLKEVVNDLNGDFRDLNGEVNSLNNKVDDQTGKVDGFRSAVDDLKEEVRGLNEEVHGFKREMGNLVGKVDDINGKLLTLETTFRDRTAMILYG